MLSLLKDPLKSKEVKLSEETFCFCFKTAKHRFNYLPYTDRIMSPAIKATTQTSPMARMKK